MVFAHLTDSSSIRASSKVQTKLFDEESSISIRKNSIKSPERSIQIEGELLPRVTSDAKTGTQIFPRSLSPRFNVKRSLNACHLTVEEVLMDHRTHPELGLSLSEVVRRRELYGPNELILKRRRHVCFKFFEQFRNPLILLLLLSALISLALREYDDAFSISLAILIVVSVAFVQEWRSEKTLEALNKLMSHVSHCIRDGQLMPLPAIELVPGDIIKLSMGDRVPADVRLINAVELEIDESSLTGETNPVKKQNDSIVPSRSTPGSSEQLVGVSVTTSIDEQKNMAFMGTLVRNGYGSGVVVGTGEHTEFGQVFRLMKDVEERRTLLQTNMDSLGKQLSIMSCIIIGFILLLGMFQQRPFMDMFTIGVSLAVAAIPEGLPIVVTVTLALGVMRMAKRQSIVKRLPSVEALGSVNVICADKTGTLTYNKMRLTKLFSVTEEAIFELVYKKDGDLTLFKHLSSCDDINDFPSIKMLLLIGNLCNNSHVTMTGSEVHGQPTETALLTASMKLGIEDQRPLYHRVSVIPFNSETRCMSVLCFQKPTTIEEEKKATQDPIFYVKGAIEVVISKCTHVFVNPNQSMPMSSETLARITSASSKMAREGLRVLALAYGRSLSELVFVGLAGIQDPPRIGVAEAISKLTLAGVRVVMITGDSKETAGSIAQQLNISPMLDDRAFMSGAEWDGMSEVMRCAHVPNVHVFYRAEPRHKLSIVQAFQENGATVAMTGDGVNDAPALKRADIGIAMGITGTDVSKEAADMIILDDNFATIVAAIEEGKSIFFNIRHFLRFQLSTSLAALALVTLSTLFQLPPPLNAMQILWINIIMDGPPAQSLGVEPVDPDIMNQPPRNRSAPMITPSLIFRAILSAAIIVCGTMYVFQSEQQDDGLMTARGTTMTFTTFVMFDMFNAMTCRSDSKSIFHIGIFSNGMLWAAITASVIGQLLVIYIPFFQSIFQTEALKLSDLAFIIVFTSSVWWLDELWKQATSRYQAWKWRKQKGIEREVV